MIAGTTSSAPLARVAALAATFAVALACLPAVALAAGPVFALKPDAPAAQAEKGYFVFSGRPGQTLEGAVRVQNVGTAAGRTDLYSVDATTGQTSGAVYLSRSDPKHEVGAWINLSQSAVALDPGQSRVVHFRLTVPASAEAGQHLGAIVAQRFTRGAAGDQAPAGGKSGFKVRIEALSVLAVQVDVPGPEHARLALTGIKAGSQPGHQSLLIGISNTGNLLLKGRGSLQVTDEAGHQTKAQDFNLDTLVPHTKIDFPVYTQGKALSPGSYHGTVSVDYGGQSVTRSYAFAITAADASQVFGSTASHQSSLGASSSSSNPLIFALIAITVLSLGTAFYFWRQRRPV